MGFPATAKTTWHDQEAIKQLGTNGGGFFNVNAAHLFENSNAWSNYLNIFAMLSISASLVYAFGHMVGNRREGWALISAMAVSSWQAWP